MESYKLINIQKLATSSVEDKYLLSYNGRYYEANYPLVELLNCLQKSSSQKEAINIYISKKQGKLSSDQVEGLIERYITPLFAEKRKVAHSKTFLYNRELVSAKLIDRFSNAFRFLFRKVYILPFMTSVLLLDGYFFYSTDHLLTFNNTTNIYTIVGLFIFMLLSSLFHELGHASACKYFGIEHGGIGFGLYLNFPVLYTNVTDIWQLGRKERFLVNIAGVYFQMYVLLILLLAYWLTEQDMVRYMLLIINLGFLMTLNPFFKFDGYWIASDLLGVPNLRSRSKEVLLYVYKRMRKQPLTKKPYLFYTNKLGRYGLLIYSFVVNIFMGYYFFYILPKFLYSFIQYFPDEVRQLVVCLSNDMTPPFALLRNIVMQLVVLFLVGFLIANLVRFFIHAKRK